MHKLIVRVLFPLTLLGAVALTGAAVQPVLAAEEPGEAGQEHAEEAHPQGAPLGFEGDLAFWSLVVFVLFVLILKRFAWGPLIDGLDNREARMRQDLADAEAARVKAEKMLAEHAQKLDQVQDEVREILAEARRDAEHAKQEIVTEAQKEAEATKNRVLGEIELARERALKDLFDHMAGQVAEATEHVLGRSLGDGDQDRLIEEALSQVSQSPS